MCSLVLKNWWGTVAVSFKILRTLSHFSALLSHTRCNFGTAVRTTIFVRHMYDEESNGGAAGSLSLGRTRGKLDGAAMASYGNRT
jgi:hypothetical protein